MLKRKTKNLHKIEFSIISKGTEREGPSRGYMAVTFCDARGKRKIIPISHGIRKALCDAGCLDVKKDVTIEKIAFSRFQLISAIMYQKNRKYFNKKERILIIGSGSVGFTACMELSRQGHKSIFVLLRKNKKIKTAIFKEVYGVSPKLIFDFKKLNKFDYIIDATGDSSVLREIINLCNPFSTVFILGTPREKSAIDPLLIHRKSIHLIGCHELTGLTYKERNKIFNEVIKENKRYPEHLYKQLSNIENYSEKIRKKILRTNKNIINIMRCPKND